MKTQIVVAKILSTKGLKGEVKLKSFMVDVNCLLDYNLYDNKGKLYQLEYVSNHAGGFVAKFIGVDDIDAAKMLNGVELSVDRELLPNLEDENFYYVDLEGLDVLDESHNKIGQVLAVHNFGAGDILEIKQNNNKQTIMVHFNKNFVPKINLQAGHIVISVSEIFDKDLVV